jgi:ribosomal protein L7Ae-like RNA K-turn-binding protein
MSPGASAAWRNWLGLARRARALAVGSHQVWRGLARRRVYLVVMAGDAGAAVSRQTQWLAREAEVPVVRLGTKVELGQAAGEPPVAVMGITRMAMAKALLKNLTEQGLEGGAWVVPPPTEGEQVRLKRRQRVPGGMELGRKRQG